MGLDGVRDSMVLPVHSVIHSNEILVVIARLKTQTDDTPIPAQLPGGLWEKKAVRLLRRDFRGPPEDIWLSTTNLFAGLLAFFAAKRLADPWKKACLGFPEVCRNIVVPVEPRHHLPAGWAAEHRFQNSFLLRAPRLCCVFIRAWRWLYSLPTR